MKEWSKPKVDTLSITETHGGSTGDGQDYIQYQHLGMKMWGSDSGPTPPGWVPVKK